MNALSDVTIGRPTDTELIRVASVPSSHVYVRHLEPIAKSDSAVARLSDPSRGGPSTSTGSTWWPPLMLDQKWIANHEQDFDVFHLHFGFDAKSPQELNDITEELKHRNKPFVYTVHDLRNPHHSDRHAHDAQLDVIVPAADALITLTPGAASEIRERWGREALVVPHPHVVDFDTMTRVQAERRAAQAEPAGFRIGVHVKSMRSNMNAIPIIRTLIETVGRLPGAVLQVNGHKDVLLSGGARHDGELVSLLSEGQRSGQVDVRIHDFFSDDDLWRYLASLDVSVLPYRFGTHSGWLEACRDLGTTVVAPTCGYYQEQGLVVSYVVDDNGLDPDSLVEAVEFAYWQRPPLFATVEDREKQRTEVARIHEDLYRSLVS
ncbi:MAG: hypothetical protein JWP10_403 [Nocardioidaceae bacterium]|nr:hypothetical protein [Nocardioidaceae bacterium]